MRQKSAVLKSRGLTKIQNQIYQGIHLKKIGQIRVNNGASSAISQQRGHGKALWLLLLGSVIVCSVSTGSLAPYASAGTETTGAPPTAPKK